MLAFQPDLREEDIRCDSHLGREVQCVVDQRFCPFSEPRQCLWLNLTNPKSVGSAAWRIEQAAPGPGQKPDIVVRAEFEIPEQNVAFRSSVRRNDDKSLPASHMVEIAFTPDSPHGAISNIPGILMNYDGRTPGMPLNGVAVKVMPNSFLMGLSSVDDATQYRVSQRAALVRHPGDLR
jgi:hypothetical protein